MPSNIDKLKPQEPAILRTEASTLEAIEEARKAKTIKRAKEVFSAGGLHHPRKGRFTEFPLWGVPYLQVWSRVERSQTNGS